MVAKSSTRKSAAASGSQSVSKKGEKTTVQLMQDGLAKWRKANPGKLGAVHVSVAKRSGLKFAPTRFLKMLKRDRIVKGTTRKESAIAMAACIEYLMAEICELAGNICQEKKKKQINQRHLLLAIQGDDEFSKLFGGPHFAVHKAGMNPAGINNTIKLANEKKGKKGSNSEDATQIV